MLLSFHEARVECLEDALEKALNILDKMCTFLLLKAMVAVISGDRAGRLNGICIGHCPEGKYRETTRIKRWNKSVSFARSKLYGMAWSHA